MYGCSFKQNYIELNEDAFQNLKVSEILSVNIMSALPGKTPDKWVPVDVSLFPITDKEKIKAIYDCINDATEYTPSTTDYDDRKLLFVTKEAVYYFRYWVN